MFKLTGRSGRRSAGSGGAPQSSRIGGLRGLRASTHPQPGTVAFQPESPQDHGLDSANRRVSGLEARIKGRGHN